MPQPKSCRVKFSKVVYVGDSVHYPPIGTGVVVGMQWNGPHNILVSVRWRKDDSVTTVRSKLLERI